MRYCYSNNNNNNNSSNSSNNNNSNSNSNSSVVSQLHPFNGAPVERGSRFFGRLPRPDPRTGLPQAASRSTARDWT